QAADDVHPPLVGDLELLELARNVTLLLTPDLQVDELALAHVRVGPLLAQAYQRGSGSSTGVGRCLEEMSTPLGVCWAMVIFAHFSLRCRHSSIHSGSSFGSRVLGSGRLNSGL